MKIQDSKLVTFKSDDLQVNININQIVSLDYFSSLNFIKNSLSKNS